MGDQRRETKPGLLDELEDGWDAGASGHGVDDAPEPDISEVDALWDFPDDDDEPEEPEPELPDERLDPEAYAAAKKAWEERVEARRQKRRIRAEAKRDRRRARADAQKQKQKQKKKRSQAPAAPSSRREVAKAAKAAAGGSSLAGDLDGATSSDEDMEAAPRSGRVPRTKSAAKGTGRPPWALFALGVVVFLAAAAAIAALAR